MTKFSPEERALNALETAQRRSIKADERVSSLEEQLEVAKRVAVDAHVRLEYAENHPDLPQHPADVPAQAESVEG